MTHYLGFYMLSSETRVLVKRDDGASVKLDPRLDVINHSPTGFAWGYSGSGPAQLALAILCDAIGVERAFPLYHFFKVQWIAKLDPQRDWRFALDDVLVWVSQQESRV